MSFINDNLILKFGKYKNQTIGDVPASYLLWLEKQIWAQRYPLIIEYILKHKQRLLREVALDDVYDETQSDLYGDR